MLAFWVLIIIYITTNGGKRDPKDQEQAFFSYGGKIGKDGNHYWPDTVSEEQRKAAIPGTSWHEVGQAIDVDKSKIMWLRNFEDVPVQKQTILPKYGLYKPLYTDDTDRIDEPWHIAPVETKGIYGDDRKKFSSYSK